MLVQQRLKRDDLAFFKRLLGEDHDINAVDFVERSKKHPVDKIEIEPLLRYEFKEPERFLRKPLDRARHGTEVRRPNPQRPWQQQHLDVLGLRVGPGMANRQLVPTGREPCAKDAGVA